MRRSKKGQGKIVSRPRTAAQSGSHARISATISRRKAETSGMVRGGDPFVIGELTQKSAIDTRSKIPLLSLPHRSRHQVQNRALHRGYTAHSPALRSEPPASAAAARRAGVQAATSCRQPLTGCAQPANFGSTHSRSASDKQRPGAPMAAGPADALRAPGAKRARVTRTIVLAQWFWMIRTVPLLPYCVAVEVFPIDAC